MKQNFKHPADGPIYRDKLDYERRINHQQTYEEMVSTMLVREHDIPMEVAMEYAKKYINSKRKDRMVKYYQKNKVEDREIKYCTLSQYYDIIEARNYTVSPSMTGFDKKYTSTDAKNMSINKADRNYHKNLAKNYEAERKFFLASVEQNIQKTKKMKNNAHSGGTSMSHLPFAAHTLHPVLTSTTSTSTSVTNALADRILYDRRIYMSFDSIIDDVYISLRYIQTEKWDRLIKKYNLYIPTLDDLIEMCLKNTYPYFKLNVRNLKRFIRKLSPIERANWYYSLDIYNLQLKNPLLIKMFITESIRVMPGKPEDFDKDYIKGREMEDLTILHFIFSKELEGKKLGYDQWEGTEFGGIMTNTLKNFDKVQTAMSDLLSLILSKEYLPINANHMKYAIRDGSAMSDTDSCNIIYAHWSELAVNNRYHETYAPNFIDDIDDYTERYGYAVAALMSYLIVVTAKHLLRQLAANMNAKPENYDKLSYKSEYMFIVFSPLFIAKHYGQATKMKELIVFNDEDVKTAVSGVGLIAVNSSSEITKLKEDILDMTVKLVRGKIKLSKVKLIQRIADIEVKLYNDIKAGRNVYKLIRINPKDMYEKPDASPYFYHELFSEVFTEKYGDIEDPEYYGYSIPVQLDSKTRLRTFINQIEDESIKEKWLAFNKRKPKDGYGRIIIPTIIYDEHGIPDEIRPYIHIRNMILDILKPIYDVIYMVGIRHIPDLTICESFGMGDDIF